MSFTLLTVSEVIHVTYGYRSHSTLHTLLQPFCNKYAMFATKYCNVCNACNENIMKMQRKCDVCWKNATKMRCLLVKCNSENETCSTVCNVEQENMKRATISCKTEKTKYQTVWRKFADCPFRQENVTGQKFAAKTEKNEI
jgi:hypothetical protein